MNRPMRLICTLIGSFALAACSDITSFGVADTSSSSADGMSESAARGKELYESSDLGCLNCHGADGQSTTFKAIDLTATGWEHSDDPTVTYSYADYIDLYMPLVPNLCTGDCAEDIAAYLYYLAGIDTTALSVSSPLARLTNAEFVSSIRSLLELSDDSENIQASLTSLAAESEVAGLASDSDVQTINETTIGGLATTALAASEDLIDEANDSAWDAISCDTRIGSAANNFTDDFDNCLHSYASELLSQATARALSSSESTDLVDLIENIDDIAADDFSSEEEEELKLGAVITYVFLHPDFLFFTEEGDDSTPLDDINAKYLSSSEIAKRLSYFLTGTSPDDLLLADALAGNLLDNTTRSEHVDRLLESDEVSGHYFSLVNGWLGIDEDKSDEEDIALLNTFIKNWILNEQPFTDLYSGSYDVELTDNTTMSMPVGILGAKSFVESHTSYPTGGFINRGDFVTSRLLCADMPDDVPVEAFDADIDGTAELFHYLKTEDCASCHKVFDNYGAQFQEFDDETSLFTPNAVVYGTSFDLYTISDITATLDGTVLSLANTMANSEAAPSCMSELLFRNAFRRSLNEGSSDDVLIEAYIADWLSSGDTSLKSLLKTIATSDEFITLYE